MDITANNIRVKKRTLYEYYGKWFDSYCNEHKLKGEERHSIWRYYKMNPERFILNVKGGFDYV